MENLSHLENRTGVLAILEEKNQLLSQQVEQHSSLSLFEKLRASINSETMFLTLRGLSGKSDLHTLTNPD